METAPGICPLLYSAFERTSTKMNLSPRVVFCRTSSAVIRYGSTVERVGVGEDFGGGLGTLIVAIEVRMGVGVGVLTGELLGGLVSKGDAAEGAETLALQPITRETRVIMARTAINPTDKYLFKPD
jgi:hypothetical protein